MTEEALESGTLAGMLDLEDLRNKCFVASFKDLSMAANQIAFEHGFDNSKTPQNFVLMHSEISEAVEAHRKGNPPSEHLPGFSSIEEEMADLILRVIGSSEACGWRTAEAVIAKMEFNRNRPYHHGNKAY